MGGSCSVCVPVEDSTSRSHRHGDEACTEQTQKAFMDPLVYDMVRKTSPVAKWGQHHLLYRKRASENIEDDRNSIKRKNRITKTRLVLRQRGTTEKHVYAIRYPKYMLSPEEQEECDESEEPLDSMIQPSRQESKPEDPYLHLSMKRKPVKNVNNWVCVSKELDIYVCDTGLSYEECNQLVRTTETACKGNYAAYTYAKQTLGCREYPVLAQACFEPVHRVTHMILDYAKKLEEESEEQPSADVENLQLDDREPHIVKYDVTRKERQKLDMHTDKSEWTFLIALSDGCGLDYEGGGTYFEALNTTVHVQRGHALIFPGKLRHCGQRITKGLRFLLVGFLVDKQQNTSGIPPTASPPPVSPGTTDDYTTLTYEDVYRAEQLADSVREPLTELPPV